MPSGQRSIIRWRSRWSAECARRAVWSCYRRWVALCRVDVSETLGAPTVSMALWNHDNNQHAEDENLRLGNLWDGISIIAAVMTQR